MYIVRIAEPCPSQGENRSRQAATCRPRSTAQCEGTAPHEAIMAPIRPASAKKTSPQIVATLDLSKPNELAAEKMIRSATTGRWPLWRLLGMRRHGERLILAVEWKPRQLRAPRAFSLVSIDLNDRAIRWRDFPDATAAAAALLAQPEVAEPSDADKPRKAG